MFNEPLPGERQGGKAADADCQTARRPRIGQRDDPERRTSVAASGRCWNHSDAYAATNHLANRIEIRQADTQLQAAPGPSRMVFHLILEGVARREADMVIGKGITK